MHFHINYNRNNAACHVQRYSYSTLQFKYYNFFIATIQRQLRAVNVYISQNMNLECTEIVTKVPV